MELSFSRKYLSCDSSSTMLMYQAKQKNEVYSRQGEKLRHWEETNTIDEVDKLQVEVIILENLEDPHTSLELGNSSGAISVNKTVKKSLSKLNVKRKLEEADTFFGCQDRLNGQWLESN